MRFVQGAASACIQTACYSIAMKDYPESKEKVVWLVEASVGIGLIMGPIIGAALYGPLGYSWTFYIYGIVLILLAFIIKLFFPATSPTAND